MHYLIVGNGAASLGAIEGIRRVDPRGRITVLGREDIPGFSKALIPSFLRGEKEYGELSVRDAEYYSWRRVELMLGMEVEALDLAAGHVKIKSGGTIEYDNLLLATGCSPLTPDVPAYGGIEFFDFSEVGQLSQLKGLLPAARRAVVLGEGAEAVSLAESLAVQGIRVALVSAGHGVLTDILDFDEAEILQERMESFGVSIFSDCVVEKIIKKPEGALKGVLLEGGVFLESDLVLNAGIGQPNTSLAENAGLKVDSGVIVNRKMKTPARGVFAAGNVSLSPVVEGRGLLGPSYSSSYHQGICAGKNMAGSEVSCSKHVPVRTVRAFGMTFIQGGVPLHALGEGQTEIFRDEGREILRRLYIEEGRLKGYLLAGNVADAGIYAALLRSEIKIDTGLMSLLRKGRLDPLALPSALFSRMWEHGPCPL